MNPHTQKMLDKRFEAGKNFLVSHPSLLEELVCTFEKELHQNLKDHSFIYLGNKIAIPSKPDLSTTLSRQVIFAWGLGYAIGSAGGQKKEET